MRAAVVPLPPGGLPLRLTSLAGLPLSGVGACAGKHPIVSSLWARRGWVRLLPGSERELGFGPWVGVFPSASGGRWVRLRSTIQITRALVEGIPKRCQSLANRLSTAVLEVPRSAANSLPLQLVFTTSLLHYQ